MTQQEDNAIELWRLVFLLILIVLAACQVNETSETIEVTQETTSTPTPISVPTPFPKLDISDYSSSTGEPYTEEQLMVMNSEEFEEKVEIIDNWWLYWAYAAEDQQPYNPALINAIVVPFFDEDNPESYALAIEVNTNDGEWHILLPPIDTSTGEFRQYPSVEFDSDGIPLETGYDIPKGFGPLEVTWNIAWSESLGWVRLNDAREITEFINMETGQWEKYALSEEPDVIASNLGLKENRDYVVQDNYLVDVKSGLLMAVFEGTDWELTSDEERFGELADMQSRFPLVAGLYAGDMLHVYNENYKLLSINAVFTGYIDIVEWNFPDTGEDIRDYRGLVVYRDGDGSIKKFWVSMFSPDLQGTISFRETWSGNGSWEEVTLEEALQKYKPGQVWNIDFVYSKPEGGFQEFFCSEYTGYCTDDYNRLLYLLKEQADNIKVFAESLLDEDPTQSVVPEGMVIAPDTLSVHTD